MRTISHRELRNESSAVLRDVANGESFAVTNRGEVVATLAPVDRMVADLPRVRPARTRPSFQSMRRHEVDESVADAMSALRGER